MRNEITEGGVSWIDIHSPSQEDVSYLAERYPFHPVATQELLSPSWRTKAERFDGHLFLVFYFPVHNKERRETRAREIDFIVSKNAIVTAHYNSIVPLKGVFDRCNMYEAERQKFFEQGTGMMLFEILEELGKSCLVKLNRIGKKMEAIESDIFRGKERAMLQELLLVKTDIIDFYRIVVSQQKTFESLRRIAPEFFGQEHEPYYSHLAGTWEQATSDLQTYKDTVLALEQTNVALLSSKTSEVLKVLTLFSVIIFPLTLFATLFTMDTVSKPLRGYPGDFWIIIAIMGLVAFGMHRYFKKKHWI